MTFETLISRWDDYNSFPKFLVRLYLSLHLYVCVCAFHWFAEICTADVYVEVKGKKISVRVIFLTLFLAVWMGVQRYYFLAGSLHGMLMSCRRVVYRLTCVIKALVRKLS